MDRRKLAELYKTSPAYRYVPYVEDEAAMRKVEETPHLRAVARGLAKEGTGNAGDWKYFRYAAAQAAGLVKNAYK